MKAVAVTLNGIESIAAEEIKEIAKTKSKKLTDGRILFETKTLKPLEKARTLTKLYQYITHFTFKTEEEIYKKNPKNKDSSQKKLCSKMLQGRKTQLQIKKHRSQHRRSNI